MKANAIRHIQKQHLDVPHKDIEKYILVNDLTTHDDVESYFNELDEDSDNLGAGYETGSPSPSSTPGASCTPPMAHSTPVLATKTKGLVQASDAPLDFSLRNPELTARLSTATPQRVSSTPSAEQAGEQPIDLTVKGRKSASPASSAVASLSASPLLQVNMCNPAVLKMCDLHCNACHGRVFLKC